MEAEARERLDTEGVAAKDMLLQRSMDMMYAGQWRSLTVPVSTPFASIEEAVEGFHRDHEREYAFRRDDASVDLFRLNLTAIGVTQKAELQRYEKIGGAPTPSATRPVKFDELDAPVDTPIYQHEDISAGTSFNGPAIVEQLDSTTVIPPGVRVEVDEWLNIRIYVTEDSK
jgi:N-methylhydantoinase A